MNLRKYREAYDSFRSIAQIIPTRFRDIDKLMPECILKGQVRIAVVPRCDQRNWWILDIISPQIKAKILAGRSQFLKLVPVDRTNMEDVKDELSMAKQLGSQMKLHGLVILSISNFDCPEPFIQKDEIKLCYLTKHKNKMGVVSYTGKPVTLYKCTQDKILRLGISYEFINVQSDEIISSEIIPRIDSDDVQWVEFTDINDFFKDKQKFVLNCPKTGNTSYSPQWYPWDNFEKKNVRSDEEMVAKVVEDIPGIIARQVLVVFDK